jgi:D-3-phosphoglycerate dehydrogenase
MQRLAGGTVGIVGFGTIGRRFARRLEGFDVTVLAADPYVDATTMSDRGVRKHSFQRLLEDSDAVSVHTPLTPEGREPMDVNPEDNHE